MKIILYGIWPNCQKVKKCMKKLFCQILTELCKKYEIIQKMRKIVTNAI